MTTQPKAISIAENLEQFSSPAESDLDAAAAELRRQHEQIEELEAQLAKVSKWAGGGMEVSVEAWRKVHAERDALQSRLAEIERQTPAGHIGPYNINEIIWNVGFEHVTNGSPLYAHPVAAPALTNGEIYTAYIEAANQTLRPQDERIALAFARAIESAVRGKV